MVIIKGIMMLVFLLIIPILLGILATTFMKKEKNNLILAFVIGYLIEFAICQLISVPMIFLEMKFTTLLYLYIGIIVFLSGVSIVINRKNFKDIIISNLNGIKSLPKLLTIVAICIIFIQVYGLVGYMHEDADDAFYVGTATTTIYTNTLYKYSPTTGAEAGEQLLLRYRLGPFPLFHTIMSKVIDIHPTIFIHSIIPSIFIILTYAIFAEIGKKVFDEDNKKVLLFIIVLSILFIWGNYSRRTNFSMLLLRIWQGKAVLANIIIPSIWLMYLVAIKNDFKFINYITFLIAIFAGA